MALARRRTRAWLGLRRRRWRADAPGQRRQRSVRLQAGSGRDGRPSTQGARRVDRRQRAGRGVGDHGKPRRWVRQGAPPRGFARSLLRCGWQCRPLCSFWSMSPSDHRWTYMRIYPIMCHCPTDHISPLVSLAPAVTRCACASSSRRSHARALRRSASSARHFAFPLTPPTAAPSRASSTPRRRTSRQRTSSA